MTDKPASDQTTARGLQIACFDLCQQIGMEIETRGRAITSAAVHFPATHDRIKASLAALHAFADRAGAAVEAAHAAWRKHHGR